MTRNEVTYDLIERYLNDQLSPEELQSFSQRMEKEDEFAEEVFLLKEIRKQAYQEDQNKLALLNELGEKYFTAPKIHLLVWMKLAAAAFIGVVCISVIILSDFSPRESFMETELDFTEMSAEKSSLSQGEKFYKEENYGQALKIFSDYLKDTPDHIEVMEAAGLCYLNLGSYERASSTFHQILNSDAIYKYKDNARWHLAVNAFKAEENQLSKKYLEEVLADSKSRNRAKAEKLLKQLN